MFSIILLSRSALIDLASATNRVKISRTRLVFYVGAKEGMRGTGATRGT